MADAPTFFNDPLVMAGLQVMQGKGLGDALVGAAELKAKQDHEAAQTQLWQIQAAQALNDMQLNNSLMSDPRFGYSAPSAPDQMPVMQGATPPGMGGQAAPMMQQPQPMGMPNMQGATPPGFPAPSQSQIPAMPDYMNTPEAKNATWRMLMGSRAKNTGVVEAAKADLQSIAERAKANYENQVKPIVEGAKAKAAAQGEAEGKLNNVATEKGKQQLDSLLQETLNSFQKLRDQGGLVDDTASAYDNSSRYMANTGFGQVLNKMVGSKNQTVRQDIMAKQPLIKQAIMQATGMSSKQVDSNQESQNLMEALASPTSSYQSVNKIISDLSRIMGGGTVKAKENAPPSAPQGNVPAAAIQHLKMNPQDAGQFEAKYGVSAKSFLGGK